MASYEVQVRDQASRSFDRIGKSAKSARESIRSVGDAQPRMSGMRRFAGGAAKLVGEVAKGIVVQTASRVASEAISKRFVRGTARAQMSAARATNARTMAEKRLNHTIRSNAHTEAKLLQVRKQTVAATAPAAGGGATVGGAIKGLSSLGEGFETVRNIGVLGGVGIGALGLGAGAIGGVMALAGNAVLSGIRALASALGRVASVTRQVAIEFGSATIAAFDFRSRATTAFKALVGEGDEGFERLKKTALEMRMSLGDTFEGIRAMLAAGFKESDATRLFKRLQDLKGIGLTQEVLGRVTLAIAQIKGAGTLQGDELRQLMETGLDIELVWKSISKQMGVSIEKAKKLKEQGKVTAKVAIQAIEETISQKTGGRAAGELGKEMARSTFAGFRATMGLIRELLFDRIAGGVGGEGVRDMLASLNDAADNVFKWMKSDDAAAVFSEIGYAVKGVTGDFKTLVESPMMKRFVADLKDLGMGAFRLAKAWWDLGKVFVAGFMGKGAMELGGIKDAMADSLKLLKSDVAKDFFRKLGETVRWSVDNLIKFSVWVNQALGEDLNNAGKGIKNITTTIGSSFGEGMVYGVMSGISTLASEMLNAGVSAATSLIDGLIGGLLAGIPRIAGITTTMGETVKTALKGEWNAHSPSRDFELIGASAPEGAARGIASNDNARAAAETMGREVKRAAIAGMQAPTVGTAAKAAAAEGLIGPNYGVPVAAAGGGGLPPGAVGGTHVHYHTTTIPITIQGDVTKDVADDLEARLLGLLERSVA